MSPKLFYFYLFIREEREEVSIKSSIIFVGVNLSYARDENEKRVTDIVLGKLLKYIMKCWRDEIDKQFFITSFSPMNSVKRKIDIMKYNHMCQSQKCA